MSIRIGILGYGNLGRGVECAIRQNPDMELAAVFTRRDPAAVHILTEGASVVNVEEAPAWNPNLRSKTAIRTSESRYFVDPSIAVAALGIGPNDLIKDLNTFGLIFETLCIRDLRVYAESINGNVYHYRDALDLECDAVVHLRNGSYGLIEIKLGGDKLINEAAENLMKMKNKIDTEKMNNPSFLMVLTATGKYAYKREDGVCVVPVGCLKN